MFVLLLYENQENTVITSYEMFGYIDNGENIFNNF